MSKKIVGIVMAAAIAACDIAGVPRISPRIERALYAAQAIQVVNRANKADRLVPSHVQYAR